MEYIDSILSLLALAGILAGLRTPKVYWTITQEGMTPLSGSLKYGLQDTRAYAKVLAAGEYVAKNGKPMANTKREIVEDGFSVISWRRVYRITFHL